MDNAHKISITVCGDGGCGKSSITLRLVRSQWTHEYDPTIEDSYSVTRNVDGQNYLLMLTDTAGQEEYRGLWAASNLKSDAFLLVYDITNANSLDGLEYFTEMIDMETERRLDSGELPPAKIVAGNKCDLQSNRQVRSQQGLEWARNHRCGFMETSAREMVNIEETFALLVRRVVEARRLRATGQTQGQHSAVTNRGMYSIPAGAGAGVAGGGRVNIGGVTGGSSEKPHTRLDPDSMRGRKKNRGFWGRVCCCCCK